jgi:serine/threonine protein kinase
MEKLGEGGQSVVRRIVERSTDKEYAAKIIRNVDAEKIINIKHQYKLLKALNFPTIVKAYYLFISE